jgi:hypothetical protein
MDGKRLLSIYLNDHLAGATGGRALAERSLGNNRGTPYGETLASILPEIEQDMRSLHEVMRRVGAKEDPVKPVVALVVERVARLKLNGRLVGYSPLSRLIELEGLVLGITGKRSMWSVLGDLDLPELADMPFDGLTQRADSQIERLEAHRRTAAAQAVLG